MKKIPAPIKQKITAIIPAFDEEKTVADVLTCVTTCGLIDEVICINDASSDDTKDIINSFKDTVRVKHLKKNKGKGYAIAEGVSMASGDIVLFLDADLINFSKTHIEMLLSPVLHKGYAGTVGFITGFPPKRWKYFFSQSIGGQRVYYKKDLMKHLPEMKKSRFGMEILLNDLFEKKKIKKVILKDLDHLLKHEKYKGTKMIKETVKEVREVGQTIVKRHLTMPSQQAFKRQTKYIKRVQKLTRDISKNLR